MRGDAEVPPDPRIGEELAVVLQADEDGRPVHRGAELGEGIAEGVDERENVEDDQKDDRWNNEHVADGKIAPSVNRRARSIVTTSRRKDRQFLLL
jgi:hypothetical protein